MSAEVVVAAATAADLPELVPLVGAYLDFYGTPKDPAAIEAYCRTLLADPEREGVPLLARDAGGAPLGLATILWTWTTTRLGRLAVMNDLFVAPEARGRGAADALILACRERAREHGCVALEWQTALDNHRAQKVYDRVGGERSRWLSYALTTA